ncbi:MAG TPA: flagellar biosynthetic protein FliR [Bryobacteraceae bacterium]|nr:flagellar biosynthetic protein FliR [Bryobacteraceae bacterium]
MGGELVLSTATLLGFLLTLARVAGVFVFVPLPGLTSGFAIARTLLALSMTMALYPYWPHVPGELSAGLLFVWMISEAALGIGIGLTVAFVTEAINVAAQVMGLQAGYAYASTVDPNTQADSTVLVLMGQLATGLLFFSMGLDREVIRIFVHSMEVAPPGSFVLSPGLGRQLLSMGSVMFSTGVRLALPVVAILLLVDISLALLGRVNSQLQLLTVAFSVKMMLALAVFGWLMLLLPTLLRSGAAEAFSMSRALLAR